MATLHFSAGAIFELRLTTKDIDANSSLIQPAGRARLLR